MSKKRAAVAAAEPAVATNRVKVTGPDGSRFVGLVGERLRVLSHAKAYPERAKESGGESIAVVLLDGESRPRNFPNRLVEAI